jgi:hypothetical protein
MGGEWRRARTAVGSPGSGLIVFCERLAQKGGSVAGSKAETSSLILSPADKSGEDDGYKGRARVWVGQSAVCDAA